MCTGEGGWGGNQVLGQDGTAIGVGHMQNNESWQEVLPQESTMWPLGTLFPAGTQVGATTQYYNGVWSGTIEDAGAGGGAYVPWSHPGDKPGNTAESIAERPLNTITKQFYLLSNLGTMRFSDNSSTSYIGSIMDFFTHFNPNGSREGYHMTLNGTSTGRALDTESDIGGNGFTVTQLHCG